MTCSNCGREIISASGDCPCPKTLASPINFGDNTTALWEALVKLQERVLRLEMKTMDVRDY